MPAVARSKPSLSTHLTSLKSDVNATILNLTKGTSVKAATLNDLKKWLDSAAKSPTDGVKTLRSGFDTGRGSTLRSPLETPTLSAKSVKKVLTAVSARLERESAAKGSDAKKPSQKELQAWIDAALIDAAKSEIKVKLKSGDTRPATVGELTRWLKKAN